jgi:hypothetical protein
MDGWLDLTRLDFYSARSIKLFWHIKGPGMDKIILIIIIKSMDLSILKEKTVRYTLKNNTSGWNSI